MSRPIQSYDESDPIDDPENEEVTVDENDVAEVVDQDSDAQMSDSDDEEDNEETAAGQDEEDFVDESIQGFFEHKDSIYCLALSPTNSDLCATGGGDELGYLWNISTGESLATLTGHTDSITSIEFSYDGLYLATAGMDGLVRVWKVHQATSQCEFITVLEAGSELMWLHFHPKGYVIIAGTADSTVWMWSLPKGDVMGVFAGHTASSTAGVWAADGKTFSSVSEDGTIIQWDPKTTTALKRWDTSTDERLTGGEGGWNVIALDSTGNICTVGSPDGIAKVINLTTGALIASLESQTDSIEAIAYSPTLPLLATASIDGSIALYSLPTLKLQSLLRHDDAVVGLHFSLGTPHLYSCSTDRTLRTWDVRTSAEVSRRRGHQDAILCMGVTCDGRRLVSAGDDQHALVFAAQ